VDYSASLHTAIHKDASFSKFGIARCMCHRVREPQLLSHTGSKFSTCFVDDSGTPVAVQVGLRILLVILSV
jgi:hypothetical protein